MKIFNFLSRFAFERSMNTFDVFCILMVSSLVVNSSWWWCLLYIITIPISATCQTIVEKQQGLQ